MIMFEHFNSPAFKVNALFEKNSLTFYFSRNSDDLNLFQSAVRRQFCSVKRRCCAMHWPRCRSVQMIYSWNCTLVNGATKEIVETTLFELNEAGLTLSAKLKSQ